MVSRLSKSNVHEEVLKIYIHTMLSRVPRLSSILSSVSYVYPQLKATGNQIKRTITLWKLLDFSGLNIAGNIWGNVSTLLMELMNVEMLCMTHMISFKRSPTIGWLAMNT